MVSVDNPMVSNYGECSQFEDAAAISNCCKCGADLMLWDDFLVNFMSGETYCNSTCLAADYMEEIELIENKTCSWCGCDMLVGYEAYKDINNEYICSVDCVQAKYDYHKN